jgi:hypothetical protein
MLKYDQYAQYNRRPYSCNHVEKSFYKIQARFKPSEGDKFLFISVNPENNQFDWFKANNASNAFDFKIRRLLWKRKGKHIRPYVGAIEKNEEGERYHFHGLLHLSGLKTEYSDREVLEEARQVILKLHEVGKCNRNSVRVDLISYSETTRDYGRALHYMVKSACDLHDPLLSKVYNRKEQEVYGSKVSAKDDYL